MQNWLRSLHLSLKDQGVAIDGKSLRGAVDAASGKSALHLVSAWASGLRLSLGQVAVDGKWNEITAVPQLLDLLELTGAVVTMDAMHCQKNTVTAIRAKGADYLTADKDNQPKLHTLLQELFISYGELDYKVPGLRCHKTVERNRGRDETRICYAIAAPEELRRHSEWTKVQSVVMIYRECQRGGKLQHEVSFFLTSLPPKVKPIASYIRGHWGIENNLHWTGDPAAHPAYSAMYEQLPFNGTFNRNTAVRLAEITDGTSNTIGLGERASMFAPTGWAGIVPTSQTVFSPKIAAQRGKLSWRPLRRPACPDW